MPQTFYIESDEEIISVIGRLRKSSAEKNIFVFPKRALVLQSIINLRLFQREAEKLGKKIVIVSQDEVGKMLALKAGIETESYSEDFSKKAAHLELTAQEKNVPLESIAKPVISGALRSDAIGSSNFYATESAPQTKNEPLPSAVETPVSTLRVRNITPPKLTSLNSKRFEGVSLAPQAIRIPLKETEPAVVSSPPLSSARAFAAEPYGIPQPQEQPRDERLKNFYSNVPKVTVAPAPKKDLGRGTVPIAGKKAHKIFFILGGISLLSLVSVVLFFFLPKAEIQVTPYAITQTTEIEMDGRSDVFVADDGILPVRILEKEKEVALTFVTTGKSGGTNQKARGTVVIYNNYSAESQSLVATTRLETTDGKLFRLTSGVVVPGMTNSGGKKEPGAIEASVVADQAGAEYNIDATSFTIPGFKGGTKYTAFSARSTKTMTGGGSGGVSDVAVVAKVDLETAEREAKEKVKDDFLSEIRGELLPNERALDEQVETVLLAPVAMPTVGTAASAFDYKATFKVRVFVFSEKTVKEKAEAAGEKNLQGIKFKPISSDITYSDSMPNFSEGTLRLRARALLTMESDVDRDSLREALLGKSEEGIKQVLDSFPEVKTIKVIFHPQLFMRSIPDSRERVFVLLEPGEKME
ncbi:MAG: hypothetical protein Q7S04_04065 [Candidatus Moranbacteria bacterium]|nr:hypothetical protein [Candidatus Moranbacteria bacterium]